MSISITEPEKTRILSDAAMIAAYVHPTRMKILSCLAGEPATLTQTARHLGTPPANLSRHFRKLEAAGLIRLVETKVTDKNIQKYYRAVARSFVIGGAELPQSDKAVVALAILQEELGLAASRAREQAGGEHLVLFSSIRIPESRRREFMQRLQELIQAFGSEDDPTGEPYTLAGALFPAAASDIGASNVTIGGLAAWATPSLTKEPEPALRPAWALYRSGNFDQAKAAATPLLEQKTTTDAGLYLLCLISHLEGQYTQSIEYYQNIRRTYPKRKLLAEAVAWSYIHLGDYTGAIRHLEGSGAPQDPAQLAALGYWKEHPLRVEASGVAEIPFTEDGLSPWMPGFTLRINGQEVVARLDTGGSFIHLSPTWAERLGVRSTVSEKGFASLEEVGVGYGGFVDLELGTFVLRNVPVYVLDHLDDQSKNLAVAFGEELGPIVGTNVFQQFLTTIDGPGHRMVLSPREDSVAAADHAARLSGQATEIPFTMWLDHFMTAGGSLYGAPVRLFFDSGLVTGNAEQGQASLLVPLPVLESWGAAVPEADRLAILPAALNLGGMKSANLTACAVPQATWHAMGDWGGVAVHALISWGFLKDLTWTIDFDRRVYIFRK